MFILLIFSIFSSHKQIKNEQLYEKFLEVLEKFFEHQVLPVQRRKPKMSDLEVISINLTAEYLSIDSELQLFRKSPNSLKNKIERSVYNRRNLTKWFGVAKKKISPSYGTNPTQNRNGI